MAHVGITNTSIQEELLRQERALGALESGGRSRTPEACELLLAIGDIRSRSGDAEAAREAFASAAQLSRELQEPGLLTRAAIGFGARFVQAPGAVDETTIRLLEEALGATAGQRSVERVRLLGQLCSALYYSDGRDRLEALSREALAIADELADPLARAYACSARHRALWEPEHLEERLAAATDMIRLAERARDPELVLQGRGWLLVDQLERGDIEAADGQQRAFEREAKRLGDPLYLWHTAVFAAMRAILAGEFERGELLTRRAAETGQLAESAAAVHYVATEFFAIRRDQGRLGELLGSVEEFVARFPTIPAWRCALALVYQELGREDDARRELSRIAGLGFENIPRDANWLVGVTLLAEASASLRERACAEALYGLLLPYRRSAIVVGLAAVCAGSASHVLGLLAAAIQRRAESRGHFEHALRMNASLEAAPLLARTQGEYALLLREWDEPGDASHAAELLSAARSTAERLPMPSLLARLPQA
jgi:hypothetical protein